MTCRELIEFLMAYLDGELPEEQRRSFDAHLEICPACVAYLKTYEETIQLGKTVCHELDEPVPDCVPDELVQAILTARAQLGPPRRKGRAWCACQTSSTTTRRTHRLWPRVWSAAAGSQISAGKATSAHWRRIPPERYGHARSSRRTCCRVPG